MGYKVGIPQGLFFYEYYPLWKGFLENLDVEIIVSRETNKEILNTGVLTAVDEACLPVKAFHGHVIDLKSRVDYLFIPRLTSVHPREFGCPKVLGIPEMVKNSIETLPPIIDTNINLRESKYAIVNAMMHTGKNFTSNPLKITRAFNIALEEYKDYLKQLDQDQLPLDIIKSYSHPSKMEKTHSTRDLTILVLGHPYVIYDPYLSMGIIDKLRRESIRVVTPESIDLTKINAHIGKLTKRMFWTTGRKIVGSAFSSIEEGSIDGILYVSSFGCGLDSVLIDLVQRACRNKTVPFSLITVDEHTGEAGVNTRIEAFIDMMRWRDKNESNISTHG